MAAVLKSNMGDIKKITQYMEECNRIGVKVLGPDINESRTLFAVTPRGEIRFGLGALKNVGEGAVEEILAERDANGPFSSLFDLTSRVNQRALNKRSLESMAKAGAFDFDNRYHRAQYFKNDDDGKNGIELALKFGISVQSNKLSGQGSLFGGGEDSAVPREPKLPAVEKMPLLEELREEEDVVGIYLSKHPLDSIRFEYDMIKTCDLKELAEMQNSTSTSNFVVMGIVTATRETISQKGEPYGRVTLMDYSGSHEFTLFNKDYLKFKHMLGKDYILVVKGSFEYSERNQKTYARYHEIVLSSEIQKDTLVKSVQIDMEVNEMLKGKATAVETVMMQYPGKCTLWIHLMDNEESMGVKMIASKGFEFCAETIQIMEDMEIRYNKKMDERWMPVSPPPPTKRYY